MTREETIKTLKENLCDSCINRGCIFQSGIVRSHCDFYKGGRMRLIDADALLICIPYEDVTSRMAVANAPTIEPERKKGKWVGYDGDWLKTMCKCSECGAMIDINEKYRNFFCYHCGARMEDNNESD